MLTDTQGKPQYDTRDAQAVRVADYMEAHPASTAKEVDAACDTGCISKVISVMPGMGYVIDKGWRDVPCATGNTHRRARVYTLIQRPGAQPDLFSPS